MAEQKIMQEPKNVGQNSFSAQSRYYFQALLI